MHLHIYTSLHFVSITMMYIDISEVFMFCKYSVEVLPYEKITSLSGSHSSFGEALEVQGKVSII